MAFEDFDPFLFNGFIGFATINKFIANQATLKDAIGLNTTTSKIPVARVTRTATQNIARNVRSFILWQTELDDTDDMVDVIVEPERVTIKTSGFYIVNAYAIYASNNQGRRQFIILKNNALGDPLSGIPINEDERDADSGGDHFMEVNATVPLSANDTIAITTEHSGPGGGLNILQGSDTPFLNIVRVA